MAVTIKLKNVEKTFEELGEEVTLLINLAQRASAFSATAELSQVTPVDTGRARASWNLNNDGRLVDSLNTINTSKSVLGPVSKTKIETLYITNGTPYIQELNAGSSQQAPPRFIEKTIAKYFEVSGNFVRVV